MKSLLQPQNIFEADDIGHPQIFVELLPVPTAKLGGKVVDVIKLMFEKNTLDLPVMADVALVVIGSRVQAAVGHNQGMPPALQRFNQARPNRASCSQEQYLFHRVCCQSAVASGFPGETLRTALRWFLASIRWPCLM